MGNLKRGRPQGTFIVLIVFGLLFSGGFLSHYFQAKGEHKPINQQKNDPINRAMAKGPVPIWDTDELRLEKEHIRKQQELVIAWRNQQEREKSNVKEPTTTEPASNATASSGQPINETIPARSE